MTTATQATESGNLSFDGEIQYDLHEVAFVRIATLFMLSGTLILCLVWAVSAQWTRLLGTMPYAALGCVTLYLLHSGQTPTAFRVLAWGAWICAVNGLAWTNGIYAPGVVVFFLVIAFSGYLVSSRATIALVVLTIAVLLLAAVAAQERWPVPIASSPAPIYLFVVYTILVLCAGALGLSSVQTYHVRLDRLRQSESVLAEKVAQLTQSESRLARAMDATSDGLWEWDTTSGQAYFSPAYFRMLGYEQGEFASTAQSWFELMHPEDRERALAAKQDCIDNRVASFATEFRMRAKNGHWRWILSRGKAVKRDPSGKALLVVGTHVDITERRSAEQDLRDWRERTRAAERVGGLGTWYVKLPEEQIRWSEGTYRIFGIDPGQPAPGWKAFIQMFHPDDRGRVKEAVTVLYRDREVGHVETRIVRPDGEIRHLLTSATLTCDSAGTPLEMIGASMDITEHMRVEEALRLSDQRLQQAVRVANIGIFDHDHRTDTIYLTPEQRENYGWGPDEPVSLPRFLDRVLPEDRETIAASVSRAHDPAGDGVLNFEHRIVRRDGEIRWLKTQSQTFFEGEGKKRRAVRTIGAVLDITESRSLEEVRIRSQKLESLGTLAGGIAHDFNNILLAINGNAKLALQDLDPEHLARASVAAIARAGQRAAALVRRILTFSRHKAERQETLELRPVVEEALKLLRSTLPATIEFRTRCADDAPLVAADPAQVHEAILNLATNAAYAIGDRAGRIEFTLERVEVDPNLAAKVPGLHPGRYACLTVADDGRGMDTPTVARIFDAFFTTKPAGQGTGLGLSMVHGIVTRHQGAIDVTSEPGKGSIFRLYFPAADSAAKPGIEQSAIQATPKAGRRVLYVDDEDALVLLASRTLERLGHRVSGFIDAKEALEQFRSRPGDFDVVVTDLSMPQFSGFDIAREVHAIRPELPLIMTSGYVRPEDEERARAAGIKGLILKPNTIDELGQVLDQLFQDSD